MKKIVLFMCLISLRSFAQENYEIQVYASPTMPVGSTIFELHSNFTPKGEPNVINGVRPTEKSWHETLEITTGITNNFELGFYLFTNHLPDYGFQFVGTHLRPRITAPESWKLPFGLSLSAEFGYQRKEYASDYWNIELRPIIDKSFGKFTVILNPTFGKAIKSTEGQTEFEFAPAGKISYQVAEKAALGTEYYSNLGYLSGFLPTKEQNHALYGTLDLFLHPDFEFDFGVGWGLTPATDGLNIKLILGRKINWKK